MMILSKLNQFGMMILGRIDREQEDTIGTTGLV